MAKIMIANNNNKAMLTRGPMALPMADITTCKPGKTTNHISLIYRGLFILHDIGYGVLTLLSNSILISKVDKKLFCLVLL
jgi:hypothetical protein